MAAPRVSTVRGRVLVVDDEPLVADVLRRYLQREGLAVDVADNGLSALRLAQAQPPDIVVLDVMLPGISGMEVCRSLRRVSAVPILMLTARGEESDKIRGLGIGADDYVVKPFSPNEVVARVKALLRRATIASNGFPGEQLQFPGIMIRPDERRVERDGTAIELASREFDLILYLARNARRVFTRDQLLDAVWGYTFSGEPSTVTVHVRRLREKVEPDPARPRYIKTVWGTGYKFDPDDQ